MLLYREVYIRSCGQRVDGGLDVLLSIVIQAGTDLAEIFSTSILILADLRLCSRSVMTSPFFVMVRGDIDLAAVHPEVAVADELSRFTAAYPPIR